MTCTHGSPHRSRVDVPDFASGPYRSLGEGPLKVQTASPPRSRTRCRLFFTLALATGLLTGLAQAQELNHRASTFYPDSSDPAETLLRNAASHARDNQWAEAIGIYQRIIDQYGEKVAKLPREVAHEKGNIEGREDFVLFVDLRAFCHRSLAKLPPEARAIYRGRVDGKAERWFREGQSKRDQKLLRRVVDLTFCSSWGDEALELLGDLSFQEGRFSEALAMYRKLVLDRPDDTFGLIHPDPSVDLARVAAKKLLCRAASGEKLDVAAAVAEFSQRFPGASGTLAGRKEPYAQILQESLLEDHLSPPSQPDSRWPTFAGSFTRSKVVAEPIDVGSLQWKVPLERITAAQPGYLYGGRSMAGSAAAPQERLLGYHPIVLGDQVIVADSARVLAFNLNDRPGDREGGGSLVIEPAWKHDPEGSSPRTHPPSPGIPRYTLTAVGKRIFVRMGPPTPSPSFVGMGMGRPSSPSPSYLIALDWSAQGKLLWVQRASDLVLPDHPADRVNRTVNFEGTPVADDHNVYVAVTDRLQQTATYIACFDAETGARRWVHYLGAASSEADNFLGMGFGPPVASDYGHRLLSLDGPYLYYQTNLGAVISLEAGTGAVRWVATYPRQELGRMGGSDRDLNPAVVHDGLVIVAPSDATAIFAFDAESGRLVWKTEPVAEEVHLAHLLGVAKGRLVATGDRVLLFDVKTGTLTATWPDSGKAESFGRGLLAGNRIYWPTKDRIEVLDQGSGLRAEPPIKLMEIYHNTGGNLVAGDGYLIVAQADALVVFCQNSRLIDRYREEIARNPDHAPTYYRLARAAEAVGRDQLALDSYEQAARKAHPAETIDDIPLADAARDHQFRLLLLLAGAERTAKQYASAGASLEAAAKIARSDGDRLRARLLLADVQIEAGQPAAAVQILGQSLVDERLRGLTVSTEEGRRGIRADLLIADRLASIVKTRGRAIYESDDARARALFERGRREQDAEVLEEVSRLYPVARVVPQALLELGQVHQNAQRPTQAAHAYKRLLTLGGVPDEARARALWRLAHVYQARNYLVSARDIYLQLQARYGRVRLPELQPDEPLADRVAAELARPPLVQVAAERPRPQIPLPLSRRWRIDSPNSHAMRILSAHGVPPGLQSSRAFLADGTRLSPLDTATGKPRWTADLGAAPSWVGYLSDKLLAATADRVLALDPTTGAEQWRYAQGAAKPRRTPDPFARAAAAPAGANGPPAALHDFHLVGGRLFCLRGEHDLLALDGESGVVDWSFSSPGGAINPQVWIGPDRVLAQVRNPNQLVVLETENGRLVAREALADGESLERAPVPIDEDHVLLVPDRRTVKKFDLSHGQFTWEYRESPEMPVNGPPRVLVSAERLLVLHDGRLLIRLDPVNGSKRWSTVLGIEDLSERPDSIACDDRRVYCASQQTLRALSIDDGRMLWSCPLTGPENSVWSLVLSERYVVAYPSASSLSDEELESMPVVARRLDNGALVQRFVFPATIADVKVKLDPRGAVVATSRALWALCRRDLAAQDPGANEP
ncbi:MAG: PQQ-binding-like beta-propeller repeat protein [Isosphaeraceae bacterium]